jgi:uncharacterized membrane protein
MVRAGSAWLAVLGAGLIAARAGATPAFTIVPEMDVAWGISGDGNVLVGSARPWGAIWKDGQVTLAPNAGTAAAVDASFDGSVVLVDDRRWANGVAPPILGPTGQPVARADALSSDGSVVVGAAVGSGAFRWENGSAIDIGKPRGSSGIGGLRLSVSGDGSTIAFTSQEGLARHAYVWKNGVMTPLGDRGDSQAHKISADGQVVVGIASGFGFLRAFVGSRASWNRSECQIRRTCQATDR